MMRTLAMHCHICSEPSVDKQATSTIQPGQTATLAVTFQKGTYELWCSVDEHKDQGMDLHITVG